MILAFIVVSDTVDSIRYFNESVACASFSLEFNPVACDPSAIGLTGEAATFGPGFWLFLAGVTLATIAGAFHYLHQRSPS